MTRNYSPIRIQDPVSFNHLVRLCPNQNFKVELSSYVSKHECAAYSTSLEFFELKNTMKVKTRNEEKTVYDFNQSYDLDHWSSVSSLFLGEVVILTNVHDSSLCVILESSDISRRHIVTVINPFGHEIKVFPNQIIEIVIYDHADNECAWNINIVSGDGGLKYEQIQHRVLHPGFLHFFKEVMVNGGLPMIARSNDPPCVEHHFWLKPTYDSNKIMSSLRNGIVYSGGKLLFENGDCRARSLNVKVGIKNNNSVYFPVAPKYYDEYERYRNGEHFYPFHTSCYRSVSLCKKKKSSLDSNCKIRYYDNHVVGAGRNEKLTCLQGLKK